MKKVAISILGLLLTVSVAVAQQTDSKYSIRFNNTTYTPQANAKEFIKKKDLGTKSSLLKSRQPVEATEYLVLQFAELPSKSEMDNYAAQGIQLNQYIGSNAYFATVKSQPSTKKYTGMDKLYAAFETTELNKIDARITENRIPNYAFTKSGQLRLAVSCYKGVSTAQVQQVLHGLPYARLHASAALGFFTVELDSINLHVLAQQPWIITISLGEPKPVHYDERNRGASGENLYIQRNPNNKYTGKGVTVGIWDTNLKEHIDVYGRLTVNQAVYYDYTADHGMHVMGIMAGSGAKDPRAKGMAPEAKMESYNYSWDEYYDYPDVIIQMYNAYADKGVRVTQNSYGPAINTTPAPKYQYTTRSHNLDNLANGAPDLLNVFAAGNSGLTVNEWSTAPYAAKNILQVANISQTSTLATSSSRGPTMSGAIIPQIAAIGENVYSLSYDNKYTTKSGTSMACPFVSGVATVLYQRYNDLYGTNPISSLAKALLCNGANDIFLPGPDFGSGFGEVNVPNTMEMLENKQFMVGEINTTGAVAEYYVDIPANTEEMKVMLTWNDPSAVAETYGPTLVNNLDLEVVYDRTYLPLVPDPLHPEQPAVEKVDNLNNILQVTLTKPAKGKAKIRVIGTAVPQPTQQFSVVYSFAKKGVTILTPVTGQPITAGSNLLIKWHSVGLSGSTTVELSKDGGATYNRLANQPGSGDNYLILNASEQYTAQSRFRISQDGYYAETGNMPIVGQVQNLTLSITDTTNVLSWDSVKFIKTAGGKYEVLMLNDDFIEYSPVDTVNGLSYTIRNGLVKHRTYFSVRALVNGAVGERAVGLEVSATEALKITSLPLRIDFNEGVPEYLRLQQGKYSNVFWNYIPEHEQNVLMYMGATVYNDATYNANWSKSFVQGNDATLNTFFEPANTNASRIDFRSTASMKVELPTDKKIRMKVSYRVRGLSPNVSTATAQNNPSIEQHIALWRVRVNGEAQTAANGKKVQTIPYKDFSNRVGYSPINIRQNPDVDRTLFEDRYYNLTSYAGSTAVVDFDALCATERYKSNLNDEGSQVYIASIDFEEMKPYEFVVVNIDSGTPGARPTTGVGWAMNVPADSLTGAAKSAAVHALVSNIGYQAAAGNVSLSLARYRNNDTVFAASKPVATLQPYTARYIPMGRIQFSHPESHKLLFTATADGSMGDTVSYVEYNVDSYQYDQASNPANPFFKRMSSGNQSSITYVTDTLNVADYGATIFPYPRYPGYGNYSTTFAPSNNTKRLQITFKDIDLFEGDTAIIYAGSTVLGKVWKDSIHNGKTFTSSAYDGSLKFYLEYNYKDGTEFQTHRGWEFTLKEVSKDVNKDLGIVRPYFTRPAQFSNGYTASMVIENTGSTAVDLLNFMASFQYGSAPKVIDTALTFVSYSETTGTSSNTISSIEPGRQAYTTFRHTVKGDSTMPLNQTYPLVFAFENYSDAIASNNTYSLKLMYGDGSQANDFGPNAFVSAFSMAGVSRSTTEYGYYDYTNQVIKVELGKGYPYSITLDGEQAKRLNAAFIPDFNKNKVFEEVEVIALDNDGTENHNVYTGTFWPHMYFSQAGDYTFRVAAYQDGNMSGWDFTIRVVGTPVSTDVELHSATLSSTELLASSIAGISLDIIRTGYTASTPVNVAYTYVNSEQVVIVNGTMPITDLGGDRETRELTIPVPAGFPDGEYTLNLTLVADDPITANNSASLRVSIATNPILNTTNKRGRISYTAPVTSPSAASRMKTGLPPFKVSNMNTATWVVDTDKNIDNWYLLSEQYIRTYDNKLFYDNRVVKFTFDEATQNGSYDTLANHFNSAKIQAIAFNPASKTLYGLGANGTNAAIYIIDHETGAATLSKTFTTLPISQLSGLAADLGGKLFTMRNPQTANAEIIMLDTTTNGVWSHYCKGPSDVASRVNMAYEYSSGTLLAAYQSAGDIGYILEAIPNEDRMTEVGSFGSTNKTYSLAIPAVSNAATNDVFNLDRFDITGQEYSLIDNDTKTATIVLPSSANMAKLEVNNYYFANNNAVLQYTNGHLLKAGDTVDMSAPLTLNAVKGTTTEQWTIKATSAAVNGIELLQFQFLKANNPELPTDVNGVITNNAIVSVNVPSSTNEKALVPTIITNVPKEDERLMLGDRRITSGESVIDFSSSLLISVQAVQLNLSSMFEVDVTRDPNNQNELISFAFLKAHNSMLDKDVVMQISGSSRYMKFPRGVDRSALVPTFTISKYATLKSQGKEIQSSGFDVVSASSDAIMLSVVAENSDSAAYTIAIQEESTEAVMLTFNLPMSLNPDLSSDIIGAIDNADNQVGLALPVGSSRSNAVSFSVSASARLVMVSTGAEIHSGDVLDFSQKFDVKVIAENGMAYKTYTVMPYVKSSSNEFSPSLAVNPAEEYTTIVGASGSTCSMFDAQGRLLQTIEVTSDAMRVEVSSLSGGVYYLRLDKDGVQKKITLIKK